MRAPYIFGALGSLVALASCTLAGDVDISNNTGIPITVSACATEKRLRPEETFRLHSIDFCKEPLRVSSGAVTWTYQSSPIRWRNANYEAYVGYTDRGNYLVRFQINGDGTVLVIPVKASAPVAANIEQPPGFPAKPDASAS
jgi:hypothetical protein